MEISLKHLALGFVAGAIAVVTVHELINYILHAMGLFPRVPWSMEPSAVTGVPQIVSDMFWGGLWGVLFVLLLGIIPGGSLPVQGLIYGIVAPAILGVFILVPLITGRFPLFFGGDIKLIGSVLLILAGWGAATGWLYGFLASKV
jgi:hypothetical protein